jgi:N-acyl-D-aspartate/D-glutamate deacylase
MLDLLIHGASIVDGSGEPAAIGSVGVLGGEIALVADGVPTDASLPHARQVIDAAGRALAPGFIDVHTHSDLGPLVDPAMPSTLRQGVTTVVVGNCGASPWPPAGAAECADLVGLGSRCSDAPVPAFGSFGTFLDALEQARPAVNIAALVGHGAVRQEAMGEAKRAPTGDELAAMRRLVAGAMDEGAIGLSTGLIYVPGIHAGTDEIVELARDAAGRGGIYASHIRGEGAHLERAIDETIEIGRRAGLPAHISHLKCETEATWGRGRKVLDRLRRGREAGQDVSADQYPYTAWASVLWSLLPPWAPVGELPSLLASPASRERLFLAIEVGEGDGFQSSVEGVGWDRIVIESTADASCNGQSVAQVAGARGMTPVEACCQLMVEEPETSCIGHAMIEEDVRAILADPAVMVASDGASMSPHGPFANIPVHPRNYGTFPRVLGHYVRDGVLPLETAVRKMTSLPAARFDLRARGRIREGFAADLVLFDAATVTDRADFEHPHAYPEGIDLVVVNGQVAWSADGSAGSGVAAGGGSGRILRRGDPA